MSGIDSVILGIIQGLTEFIPVSSSGHLVIAQFFLSGASDHLFLEFIDIGTTLALFIYFRKRIWGILRDIFKERRYRLAINILLTAIPAGAIGFVLSGFIETSPFFGSVLTVAIALAVVGFVMIFVDKMPKASPIDSLEELSPKRALLIGFAQVFALIPGVSRSGSTIIAGRLAGFAPAQAAEYSFLASLPIMVGVTLKVLTKDHAYMAAHWETLLISNLFAFIAGMIAIGFLLRYLSKHGLVVFGWYRIIVAFLVIGYLLVK
jgi:undecaprenyl-diphosphatase